MFRGDALATACETAAVTMAMPTLLDEAMQTSMKSLKKKASAGRSELVASCKQIERSFLPFSWVWLAHDSSCSHICPPMSRTIQCHAKGAFAVLQEHINTDS